MVAVKICGITRASDATAAVQAGANAIGLVFYAPSPRAVNAAQAQAIVNQVPAFVQIVGLFVNADTATINTYAPLCDVLQLHGDEGPDDCKQIAASVNKRWIKALAVKPNTQVDELHRNIASYRAAGASAVLLDAWHPNLKGGTGQVFDWALFPHCDTPLILAGGLNAQNVATAISQTHPYAVDVSGGVELINANGDLQKGIKDVQKIKDFIAQAQAN